MTVSVLKFWMEMAENKEGRIYFDAGACSVSLSSLSPFYTEGRIYFDAGAPCVVYCWVCSPCSRCCKVTVTVISNGNR